MVIQLNGAVAECAFQTKLQNFEWVGTNKFCRPFGRSAEGMNVYPQDKRINFLGQAAEILQLSSLREIYRRYDSQNDIRQQSLNILCRHMVKWHINLSSYSQILKYMRVKKKLKTEVKHYERTKSRRNQRGNGG